MRRYAPPPPLSQEGCNFLRLGPCGSAPRIEQPVIRVTTVATHIRVWATKVAGLLDRRVGRQVGTPPQEATRQLGGQGAASLKRGLPLGQQGDRQLHALGRPDLAQGADREFAEQHQAGGQHHHRLAAHEQ